MKKFIVSFLLTIIPRSSALPLRYYYSRIKNNFEKELFFVDSMIDEYHRCIDIGANHGTHSYFLERRGATVEAFEPQLECAKTLQFYNSPNITIHTTALSSETKTGVLHVPRQHRDVVSGLASLDLTFDDAEEVEVRLETLDSYEFSNVSFIKIDVEGHEYEVLLGAEETIRKNRPYLMVEIEDRHLATRSIFDVIDLIRSFGYEGMFLDKSTLRSIDEFVLEDRQQAKDIGTSKYINNFIFSPQDKQRAG